MAVFMLRLKTFLSANNVKKNFLKLPIVLFLITFSLFSYLTYLRFAIVNINQETYIDSNISELEWFYIKTIITEDYLAATEKSSDISAHIANELLANYTNSNQLFADIESGNGKCFEIFKQNIVNSYMFAIQSFDNDIFICNENGIVIDSEGKRRSWSQVLAESPNIDLSTNVNETLKKSILPSRNLLYVEDYYNGSFITHSSFTKILPEIDIENLKLLHYTKNLEEYKRVKFLAPSSLLAAYKQHQSNNTIVNNTLLDDFYSKGHFLTVVQTFNMYDQLVSRHSTDLNNFNKVKDDIVQQNKVIAQEHLLLVSFSTLFFLVLTIISITYNIKHYEREDDLT